MSSKNMKKKIAFGIQPFLENANATFLDLLECNEISKLLSNNKVFLAKFTSSQFLIETFKCLGETDNYSVHQHFIFISASLNPILATRFSDNIQITEAAFEVLKTGQDKSSYAFGTLSIYLYYAIHKFPDKMQDIFDLSKKIYPIMIENVDKLCMFHFIRDLITDKLLKLDYFIWICFLNLIGRNEAEKISQFPLCQSSRDVSENYYFELTETHRLHIIHLLTLFFQKSEGIDEIFQSHVSNYLTSQKLIEPVMLELALFIPPTNELAQTALDIFLKSVDTSEIAIEYLTKCVNILSIETIEFIILHLLDNPKTSNLELIMLPKFVKWAVENGNENQCKNILMYCWNKQNEGESLNKFFIIKSFIEVQDSLSNPLPETFISTVYEPWKNDTGEVDFSYKFDASLIDEDAVQFLMNLFESKS